MSKAIYIGSGNDIRPIFTFPYIKYFYYIDSQPYSNSGKEVYIRNDGTNGFSNPNFINYVEKTLYNNDFKLLNNNGDLKIYKRKEQIIYYFYNTSIPEDYDKIKDVINNYDFLIDIGYHPDIKILNATNKKITFIGGYDTYYNDERLNEDYEQYGELFPNNLIQQLHKNNYHHKFKNFLYVDWGKIIEYNNWNDFYIHFINNNKY